MVTRFYTSFPFFLAQYSLGLSRLLEGRGMMCLIPGRRRPPAEELKQTLICGSVVASRGIIYNLRVLKQASASPFPLYPLSPHLRSDNLPWIMAEYSNRNGNDDSLQPP